ncbi:hypothetical protein, partial [Clostridium acetobutylicum]
SSIPFYDDIDLIRNSFKTVKKDGQLVYYSRYKAIDFKYYSFFNVLHTKINLNELLNKDVITDQDYNAVLKEYQNQFYDIFKYTNALEQLNRIDFKCDVITDYKTLYIKLLKKSSDNYKSLKQYSKYKSSVYYNSKSMNINIYDKLEQLINTGQDKLIDISKYKNMLRFEVQLKRNKLYYLERTCGMTRELSNYFSQKDHDYWINEGLKKLIHNGDYYNIYHSEKILKEHYTNNMVNKLITLQKDISINGISEARENYNNTTFNNYINKLQSAGVNPIPIPKGEGLTRLSNIFNFTNDNIYLLDNYNLRSVA